ncbi:MAG TPA: ABC transporter substrate-binding protein [Anaeromyxobacter sp.]
MATAGMIAALAASTARAEQGISATEILLGEVEPFTGPPALLGIAYNIGTRLAIAEANEAGGVDGRKLRLLVEDDGYVAARTLQGLRKLIEDDKVFALTSISGSGTAVAALPYVDKTGIPTMASVAPVTPLYNPPRKAVFCVGQSYEEGTYQAARYLAAKFPGKKWGILTQDDDYGLALRTGFTRAVKEGSLKVVFDAQYNKGQRDFSSEMLRARAAGVEIFIAGGVISETVAMVKELEKLGSKPTVAIPWPGRLTATLKLMGAASDGIYAVDYVEPENSAAYRSLQERAKRVVGEEEAKKMNRYTLAAYASTRVLIDAMRRCGNKLTRACTIAELEKTEGFETGVMGPVSFAPGMRTSSQSLRILQAEYATLSFKTVQ